MPTWSSRTPRAPLSRCGIRGFDEMGRSAPGDALVDLGVDPSLALNRPQLETGHAPGDTPAVGSAPPRRTGVSSSPPRPRFEVGVYSTTQARLAPLHGRAPYAGGLHQVALPQPRLEPELALVPQARESRGRAPHGHATRQGRIRGARARSRPPHPGSRETWTVSVQTLQTEGFGSGHGKWSVDVHAEPDVAVLPFATGGRGLSNLSGVLLSGPVAPFAVARRAPVAGLPRALDPCGPGLPPACLPPPSPPLRGRQDA